MYLGILENHRRYWNRSMIFHIDIIESRFAKCTNDIMSANYSWEFQIIMFKLQTYF